MFAVALTAGSTAYADLPAWSVGVIAGLAYVIFGAVLEAWNQRQRSDVGPPDGTASGDPVRDERT